MWKKDEPGAPPSTAETAPPRSEAPRRSSSPAGDRATIGRSITIRGEVTGDEDLLIQGQIDGSVTLEQHAVTVGSEGRVKANIVGRVVVVEGVVEGDLTAQEQIVLRGSASVQGDIRAPRVILEDGASFRGLVDMGSPKAKTATSAPKASAPNGVSSSPPASSAKPKEAEEPAQKAAT